MGIKLPDRSTIAGGIAGLVAWGASMVLASQGIIIPSSVILPFTVMLMTAVVHVVPDAAKLDQSVKDLATIIPVAEDTYPPDKVTGVTQGNMDS